MKNKSFEEIVVMTLMEIFGERNIQVLIHHLGGYETLKEPKKFEEKLRDLFKEGADIILNYMKNKIEGPK